MTSPIVAKFGGTSVADYAAMQNCLRIVTRDPQVRVVVLSASAGVTNLLVELANGVDKDKRKELIDQVRRIQNQIVSHLQYPEEIAQKIESCIGHINSLAEAASLSTNDALAAAIVAHGELMSTMIFKHICAEAGVAAHYFDAREVITTDNNFSEGRVDLEACKEKAYKLQTLLDQDPQAIIVTQGFIAREPEGKTTVLGRGGSDYSAALFAELINAKEVHIWTDVSGIFTTDPRIEPNARRIDSISFREASEMAVFGAKVLHPATILPAVRASIPVFIGNSKAPDAGGTWVSKEVANPPLYRGIACKRGQMIISLNSLKMLGTSGFLAKVFDVFSKHGVVIDCVTTSEVSVAVTVDEKQNRQFSDSAALAALQKDLEAFGRVSFESGYSLVAVIGNQFRNHASLPRAFDIGEDYHIRMICHGASDNNLCILVPDAQTENVIRKLHSKLFA